MHPPICRNALIRPVHGLTLYLAVAFTLVYVFIFPAALVKAEKIADGKASGAIDTVEILRDPNILPDSVQRIRHAMIVAAMTGEIQSLRVPIEMNEIPPMVSSNKVPDPIEHWKSVSADGQGREILSILIKLFRSGFVRQAPGSDDEMFIWPYFAKLPIGKLTSAQQVELLTVVSPERFKAMQTSGIYDYYRIGIAHDGTWHYFIDQDM